MSHFSVDSQPRPTMRRKSSAQNLLSSFKSSSTPTAVIPPPIAIGTGSISPATGLSFAAAGGASTPTTSTAREFDALSLHSDSVPGSTLGGTGSPQLGQGASVEYLRDLVQKRIITLTYLRNIHEGRSHWFHTILISRADLEREFSNSNPDMKRRTYRFAILGLSLSNLLDINQPQDLLRGLMNTISEYDQSKDDGDKSKMRQPKRLFRPKIGKRGGGGYTEYAGSSMDSDTSYLMTPHMPFSLDYHQTLLSLLDVLSEVYNKISKILGPSPFPHSSQHMMGPLGLLSPHPGVSYLFSGDNTAVPNPNAYPVPYNNNNSSQGSPYSTSNASDEMSSSLWSIANASVGMGGGPGGAGSFMYGGALGSPPPSWSATMGELVLKIDGKFKKITSALLKELDAFARNGIKDELASLDPLLRNLKVDDGVGGGGVGSGKVVVAPQCREMLTRFGGISVRSKSTATERGMQRWTFRRTVLRTISGECPTYLSGTVPWRQPREHTHYVPLRARAECKQDGCHLALSALRAYR
ncbi:hypothetical protein LshimejAT787_0210040 [Lyophyllum shimeji]|uniref:Uncharacterized protein n=1 Tax=Lyophyllum shimeji TaxID=47721 RepID=A0A9P3UIF8_LYOSH|nr:hypothetical protein LshimejAT787_0210040 [Lyophyllum shimeji]